MLECWYWWWIRNMAMINGDRDKNQDAFAAKKNLQASKLRTLVSKLCLVTDPVQWLTGLKFRATSAAEKICSTLIFCRILLCVRWALEGRFKSRFAFQWKCVNQQFLRPQQVSISNKGKVQKENSRWPLCSFVRPTHLPHQNAYILVSSWKKKRWMGLIHPQNAQWPLYSIHFWSIAGCLGAISPKSQPRLLIFVWINFVSPK